ncbi:MAG: hypothetical protein GAK41_01063 [Burkholderia gladioli]|nr:MAG: hypothetical protein GAK41_01063 [Burkholderia gladioli]
MNAETQPETYLGACHCGAVRFAVRAPRSIRRCAATAACAAERAR